MRAVHLIDLPGVYSLSAGSEEERIARDCIVRCQPDAVIAIVDAVALERDLYLVAELLQLSMPLVIGLNRIDMAAQQGINIEPHVLEAALGAPVIPMIASKGQGVQDLVEAALQLIQNPGQWQPHRPEIRADHRQVLHQIENLLDPQTTEPVYTFLDCDQIARRRRRDFKPDTRAPGRRLAGGLCHLAAARRCLYGCRQRTV